MDPTEWNRKWCVSHRHGAPCPEPCLVCSYECEGEPRVDTSEAEAKYPGWHPGMTSHDMQKLRTHE